MQSRILLKRRFQRFKIEKILINDFVILSEASTDSIKIHFHSENYFDSFIFVFSAMTPQVLGRLLKIEKRFAELEKHPLRPLLSITTERSTVSVKFLKNILLIFYEIGIFGEVEVIKDPPENIKAKVIQTRGKIVELITKYSNWIANYVPVYARKEIDFIDATSRETAYKVRSGIEFLITELTDITPEFDAVLEEIRELSSVEDEFDAILSEWIDSGLHYPLREGDIPKKLPESHWWWFKAL